MDSRRNFIGTVASGLAGTLAAPGTVIGAGDRIRFGLIGAGDRGMQLLRDALACGNTICSGVADAYSARLAQARSAAPDAKTHQDYRALLEDASIDAVFIATPNHLHREHLVAALEAGKHVYVEKPLALSLDDARRMREAHWKAGNRTIQVGHQICSSGLARDAANFIAAGWVGTITAIRAHAYRNAPRGKSPWRRPVLPDMRADTIRWDLFLGPRARTQFDADRFANWRFYRDYSGGCVHEYLSQQLAFWYRILNLRPPETVSATGDIYLWKDGREVPDTMNVAIRHPEELLFTWDCGLGNNQLGTGEYVLGTDGTIFRSQQLRYWPQKVNRPDGAETLAASSTEPRAHVRNFLDCIRLGATPNCPFETGLRVSVACWMALESCRLGRAVRWDSENEQVV